MGNIVIGIDGGGTSTRVMASDLQGDVVAYAESGTARLDRNQDAVRNVQEAIIEVVEASGRALAEVVFLVAGIAGLDSPKDEEWAQSLTRISGLDCPQKHVNDAVIAHAGALQSKPGVIVISGTGSVVYGVTESKRHIRNYDMQHYANSGARHVAYAALFEILAGECAREDELLVQQVLKHWNLSTLEQLRDTLTHAGQGFTGVDWPHVGKLAPLITEAARHGVPIAKRACDHAAYELSIGIRLVGSHFSAESVDVAFIGSVIRSPYISLATCERLRVNNGKRSYRVVEPAFSSEAGAVLMAFDELGISLSETLLANIRRHPKSILTEG